MPTRVDVYDYKQERNVVQRVANFLTPYIRDTLGDFEPRISELAIDFASKTHTRIVVTLTCVPGDAAFRAVRAAADDERIKMLDDEGQVIASVELKSYTVGRDCLATYVFTIDFFAEASVAVRRGLARVFKPEV